LPAPSPSIEVDWLERLGGELCKRSWSNPHWEKKSGKVLALERVSLFGLPIVAGRKVEYGRINEKTLQEAREIFIRSALIGHQLGGQYPFLEPQYCFDRHLSRNGRTVPPPQHCGRR
jgi:ATP-dependent helicase HrpA